MLNVLVAIVMRGGMKYTIRMDPKYLPHRDLVDPCDVLGVDDYRTIPEFILRCFPRILRVFMKNKSIVNSFIVEIVRRELDGSPANDGRDLGHACHSQCQLGYL